MTRPPSERLLLDGPAGKIETGLDLPAAGTLRDRPHDAARDRRYDAARDKLYDAARDKLYDAARGVALIAHPHRHPVLPLLERQRDLTAVRRERDLAAQGIEAEIVPHLWSGANSAWERERGANRLAALIRRLRGCRWRSSAPLTPLRWRCRALRPRPPRRPGERCR